MTELNRRTSGTGPTVLFVHGLDSDGTVWDAVVARLADHTCVTVDLPGHGESPICDDPAGYERDALLSDLDAVLDDLDRPVVFVGHSLGGYLGIAHALTRPGAIAGLVLVSTGPGFRDEGAREKWNQRVRDNTPSYSIPDAAAAVAFHTDSMVIDRLPELTLPVTLVIGDGDTAYLGANDYMERKVPQAVRSTVEGARHYVMKSHPDQIASAIRSMSGHVGG